MNKIFEYDFFLTMTSNENYKFIESYVKNKKNNLYYKRCAFDVIHFVNSIFGAFTKSYCINNDKLDFLKDNYNYVPSKEFMNKLLGLDPLVYTRIIYYSWSNYFYDLRNLDEKKYEPHTIGYHITKLMIELHFGLRINMINFEPDPRYLLLENDIVPFEINEINQDDDYPFEEFLYPIHSDNKFPFEEIMEDISGKRERNISTFEYIMNRRKEIIFCFYRLEDLNIEKDKKIYSLSSINDLVKTLGFIKRGNISNERIKKVLNLIYKKEVNTKFCDNVYEYCIVNLMNIYLNAFERSNDLPNELSNEIQSINKVIVDIKIK